MKPKRDLSMQYNLRPLKREEYSMLEEFLYDAIFVPSGEAPPPRSVLLEPSIQNYYQDFGRAHDYCLVAEQEGMLLGAVWARVLSRPLKGYGYVDEHTPELAISVQKEFRNRDTVRSPSRFRRKILQWTSTNALDSPSSRRRVRII